jgi:hypothetical protein
MGIGMKSQTLLLALMFLMMPAFAMNISGTNYTVNRAMPSTQGDTPTAAMFYGIEFITESSQTGNGNGSVYCAHAGFFDPYGSACSPTPPIPPTPPTPPASGGGGGVSNMNHGFYYILMILIPLLLFFLTRKKDEKKDKEEKKKEDVTT